MSTRDWLLRGTYVEAEQECDLLAGDTETHQAVVEDFDLDKFIVMPYTDAERYVDEHDAEIQYNCNRSAEVFAAMEG